MSGSSDVRPTPILRSAWREVMDAALARTMHDLATDPEVVAALRRVPGRRAELEDDDRLRLRARTRHRISGVGSARQAVERGPSSDPDSSGRGSERDEDHRGPQGGAPDRSSERGEGDWPNRWLPGQ